MQNNVIAFDRSRKSAARATVRATADGFRDNIIALADYRGRARAHRTANGVFFSTAVLCTFGSAA